MKPRTALAASLLVAAALSSAALFRLASKSISLPKESSYVVARDAVSASVLPLLQRIVDKNHGCPRASFTRDAHGKMTRTTKFDTRHFSPVTPHPTEPQTFSLVLSSEDVKVLQASLARCKTRADDVCVALSRLELTTTLPPDWREKTPATCEGGICPKKAPPADRFDSLP